MTYWWLSFSKRGRNAGIAIVAGASMVAAVGAAHRRKCNPGGEVAGFQLPSDWRDKPGMKALKINRLYRHTELGPLGVEIVRVRQ